MDENTFKDRVKRLIKINKIIERLDPSIREIAFSFLKDYVSREGGLLPPKYIGKNIVNIKDIEGFFSKFNQDKPAENALLIAAYHYSVFGSEEFSLNEIREIANFTGIKIPERIDMVFLSSKREGLKLFHNVWKGKFKPSRFRQTTPVVPEPQNGSRTTSPGFVVIRTRGSMTESGFCEGCPICSFLPTKCGCMYTVPTSNRAQRRGGSYSTT